ncbi:MAG TPA: hypothetical protein VMD59_05650 [Acidimicrobiales bacterium]|nr:hypothetical protein [Acidimicrobiales bacterium]
MSVGPTVSSRTGASDLARAARRLLLARATGPLPTGLVLSGAALLLVSSAIHLHLWEIAYRSVPTLGPLFLVQAFSAILVALALAVLRVTALILAALGLVLGTICGFALVLTVGLFNFKLGFISTEAAVALAAESTDVAVLVLAGALTWSGARRPLRSTSGG